MKFLKKAIVFDKKLHLYYTFIRDNVFFCNYLWQEKAFQRADVISAQVRAQPYSRQAVAFCIRWGGFAQKRLSGNVISAKKLHYLFVFGKKWKSAFCFMPIVIRKQNHVNYRQKDTFCFMVMYRPIRNNSISLTVGYRENENIVVLGEIPEQVRTFPWQPGHNDFLFFN